MSSLYSVSGAGFGGCSMKIYLMTDMEGIAGILDVDEWTMPTGRYYEKGMRITTMQVNAAIEGFFEGGATQVDVIDGHGKGALDIELLDSRACYLRGHAGPYPFDLTEEYDGIAWVGQHAKAGTPYAHIPHTVWFDIADWKINGVSVGEFGTMAYLAAIYGVTPFFAAGDAALCDEAVELCPGIHTLAVKWGLCPGTGEGCSEQEYRRHGLGAKQLAPARACELTRNAARQAALALPNLRSTLVLPPKPYTLEKLLRTSKRGLLHREEYHHPENLVELLNSAFVSMEDKF